MNDIYDVAPWCCIVLATDTFWTNPGPPQASCVSCLQKLLGSHRDARAGRAE